MAQAEIAVARHETIRERQSLAKSQASASLALNYIHDAAENLRQASKLLDKACNVRPEFVRALDGVPHADLLEIIANDLSLVAVQLEEQFG